MKKYRLFFYLCLGIGGCSKNDPPSSTPPPVKEKKGLSIHIPHESYTPETPLVVTVTNDSTEEIAYQQLTMDRFENGSWRQIRGNLLCPCLTDCKPKEIILKPKQKKQHTFNDFYKLKGVSLLHTVFCGRMKAANFRIGILGHDKTKPAQFYWDDIHE